MGFAESMRRELQPVGITVATLSPGAVRTPIWDKAQSSLDQADDRLPEQARILYPKALAFMKQFIDEGASDGIPTALVAEAARHALYAARPRADYVLGKDARMGSALSAILPAKVMDRALMKMVG